MGELLSPIKGLLTIGSLIKAWQSIPLGHQVELDVSKIFGGFFPSLKLTASLHLEMDGWNTRYALRKGLPLQWDWNPESYSIGRGLDF